MATELTAEQLDVLPQDVQVAFRTMKMERDQQKSRADKEKLRADEEKLRADGEKRRANNLQQALWDNVRWPDCCMGPTRSANSRAGKWSASSIMPHKSMLPFAVGHRSS